MSTETSTEMSTENNTDDQVEFDLKQYRRRKHIEYIARTTGAPILKNINKEYADMSCKNITQNNAINIIIKFVKKKLLFTPKNISDIQFIPGNCRYRLWFNNKNKRYDDMSLMLSYSKNFNIDGLSEEETMAMIESLSNNVQNKNNTNVDNIKIPYVIDLRLYGPSIDMPIHIDGTEYVFTSKQRENIIKSWNKIK